MNARVFNVEAQDAHVCINFIESVCLKHKVESGVYVAQEHMGEAKGQSCKSGACTVSILGNERGSFCCFLRKKVKIKIKFSTSSKYFRLYFPHHFDPVSLMVYNTFRLSTSICVVVSHVETLVFMFLNSKLFLLLNWFGCLGFMFSHLLVKLQDWKS